jgi:cell wall-associated protease
MTAAVQSVKLALLVQTRPGAMRAQSFGAAKVESIASELRIERLVYASYAEAKEEQQKFRRSSAVAFAEFDAPIQAFGLDALHKYPWSLQNTGQKKGLKGADIGFVAMQKRIKGKKLSATKVAVLDSGINPSYADFARKVRMDLGYDFINGDKSAWDDNGHGSHLAGVIPAGGNNTYGTTGTSPMAMLIPIKVLEESGAGSVSGLVEGIQHATIQGARVINMILVGSSSSKSIESALAAAVKKNNLIVAASGNEGRGTIAYPARSKYVLSVGATGRKDTKASFSNYGTGLDLVAPGVSIPSYHADGQLLYGS